MLQPFRRIGLKFLGLKVLAAVVIVACLGQSPGTAQERFEVANIKKVRPAIVNTIAALQRRDVAAAREAFEVYDSTWNGIEMYVNTRSRDFYTTLEHGHQARINKGLEAASPDIAVLLPDAQAMLVKFDEMVAFVEKQPPLNSLYDDVARLRIVRAHLREVPPALKAQKFDKARKSFQAFDDNWDSIEDLVKAKSADSYVAIESAMIEVEKALMADKPDVDKINGLVNGIMTKYNAALAEIVKDARARQ
jgi:hypothetical protein